MPTTVSAFVPTYPNPRFHEIPSGGMDESTVRHTVRHFLSTRLASVRGVGRIRHLLFLAVTVVLVPVAYWFAFLVRFDGVVPEPYVMLFRDTVPILVVLRPTCLILFGVHRGWLRHVGVHDLITLGWAVTFSSLLFALVLALDPPIPALPRSIPILDWGCSVLIFGSGLLLLRVLRELRSEWATAVAGKRALIVGAGDAAAGLLHDLRVGDLRGIHPVGLVDDDPGKRKLRIHGVPVVGTTKHLKSLIVRHRIRLLVVADPAAARNQLQWIMEWCVESGVEVKILPSLGDLLRGESRFGPPREIRVEDLLGRRAIELDLSAVRARVQGRTVLVTGGAGSIGSELARQLADLAPERLILVDKAESPLYFMQLAIGRAHPYLKLVPTITDITHRRHLERIFAQYRPAYVFHAAAYKHVPLLESHIEEAVRNNVLGTLNVAECAARYGVEHFVLISTDKAVHPSSIMGATKRIAERITLDLPRLRASGTTFRAVRFGNVLGSNGSVVPLFRAQIAAGGPVTVTHPEVTRYFMTCSEAARLVLLAAVQPEAAGRISMLDMGEQVSIVELAENLIRLSGFEPYRDIPIVFTGMRPGEKLHEELCSEVERAVATPIDKIQIIQTDAADGHELEAGLDRLLKSLRAGDRVALLTAIQALVPECVDPLRSSILAAVQRGYVHAGSGHRPGSLAPLVR